MYPVTATQPSHPRSRRATKWLRQPLLLVSLGLGVAACADAPSALAPTGVTPNSLAYTVASGSTTCTGAAKSVDLVTAGPRNTTTRVGSVTTSSVGNKLTILFKTSPGWQLDKTSYIVASSAEDLPKHIGKGAFKQMLPNLVTHKDGVTSYSYTVSLSELGRSADRTVVVAAYALLDGTATKNKNAAKDDDDKKGDDDRNKGDDDRNKGDDDRKKGDDDRDKGGDDDDRGYSSGGAKGHQVVAWGAESVTKKKNGVSYFSYTVPTCPSSPPPPPKDTTPVTPPKDTTPRPPVQQLGAATITFDDGFESTYAYAYPILQKYGLIANVAVNSGPIDGGYPAYLTLPQLQELSGAGWAVVNHTVDHYDLTTLTDAQVQQEIANNKSWIEAHGFRGSWIFVVPYHSWGARERAIVKQYSVAARGASATQFRPTPYDSLVNYPSSDPYALTGIEPFAPGYDFSLAMVDLKRYLDAARTQGKFIDVFFHQLQPTDQAQFEQIAQLLSQYKDVIRTYDKLYSPSGAAIATR
jgi:peptidoglycan/xylan/chitin deacetylase (PgdA/CDA1 family)